MVIYYLYASSVLVLQYYHSSSTNLFLRTQKWTNRWTSVKIMTISVPTKVVPLWIKKVVDLMFEIQD